MYLNIDGGPGASVQRPDVVHIEIRRQTQQWHSMHSDVTQAARTTLTHTALETYILAAAHTPKAGLSTASHSSLGTAQLEVVEGRESIQSMRRRLARGRLSGRHIAPDGRSTGRPEDGICGCRHGSETELLCSKAALVTSASHEQIAANMSSACHPTHLLPTVLSSCQEVA